VFANTFHHAALMPSLVVGASRGLGLALTRRLAEAAAVKGDLVLAAARRPSALEELQRLG